MRRIKEYHERFRFNLIEKRSGGLGGPCRGWNNGIHDPDAPDPRLKAAARRAKPRGANEIDVKRCYNYLLY